MTKFLLSGHAGDGIGDRKGTGFYVSMDGVSLPHSWKNEGYLTFENQKGVIEWEIQYYRQPRKRFLNCVHSIKMG